jgi:sugar/nucleoside kinase (ribokinase family)
MTNQAAPIDSGIFATMGMFIIDDIEFGGQQPDVKDVIGGAGTYAVLGARVFLPAPYESKKVGWFVDAGSDFPESIRHEIESWHTGVILRETPNRLTTRGWNRYGDREERAFKYLTQKIRIEADDIINHESIKHTRCLHLICSPQRCLAMIRQLKAAHGLSDEQDLPNIIVWEPVPDECKESNMGALEDVLEYVDILSPNAKEAAAFFGEPEPSSKVEVEKVAARLIRPMQKKRAAVVIRYGKDGVFSMPAHAPGFLRGTWYPAYHGDETQLDYKVADPTGGGNAFLGGLGAGLVIYNYDLAAACACANVAASFAIEQIGTPALSVSADGSELWNGVRPFSRLQQYCKRAGITLPERCEYYPSQHKRDQPPQKSWIGKILPQFGAQN